MPNLSEILPANRVAAVVSILGALGALSAALAGAIPGGPAANTAVAAAALLSKAATVVTFMLGSQKSEALQSRGSGVRIDEDPSA